MRKIFARGSAFLGAASLAQRGLSFVAVTIAARIAGPAALGAYSLALSTAGMVASYSGISAGVTASRFIGSYPRDSLAYRKVLRLLAAFCIVGSLLAAAAILITAEPVARIAMNDPGLAHLLRFSAITVLAMIAYETVNGLLVGAFAFQATLWLAAASGIGMVALLAWSARAGAPNMLVAHATALALGVGVATLVGWSAIRPLPLNPELSSTVPRHSAIVLFGGSQAFAAIAIGVASWWVAVRLARFDPQLNQMGFYMIANQLKGVAAAAPNIVAQLVFPLLARVETQKERETRVVDGSTFVCVLTAVLLGCALIITLPLILNIYGPRYDGAAAVIAGMVAMSVIQVCGIPLTQFLMTRDVRAATLINVGWALALAAAATWLIPHMGAAGAAAAWVLAQLLCFALVLSMLAIRKELPAHAAWLWTFGTVVILSVGGISFTQHFTPTIASGSWLVELLIVAASMFYFWNTAKTRGYLAALPSRWR